MFTAEKVKSCKKTAVLHFLWRFLKAIFLHQPDFFLIRSSYHVVQLPARNSGLRLPGASVFQAAGSDSSILWDSWIPDPSKAGLTFACMNLKKLAKILELRGKIKSSISYIFKNESKYWLYNEKWCWE